MDFIAGVNILTFDRIKYPGTITWLWGRITVGANYIHIWRTFKLIMYRYVVTELEFRK